MMIMTMMTTTMMTMMIHLNTRLFSETFWLSLGLLNDDDDDDRDNDDNDNNDNDDNDNSPEHKTRL